jgi:hypothetical protein
MPHTKPPHVVEAEADEDSARAFALLLKKEYNDDNEALTARIASLDWDTIFDLCYLFSVGNALDLHLGSRWRDNRKTGLAGHIAFKIRNCL